LKPRDQEQERKKKPLTPEVRDCVDLGVKYLHTQVKKQGRFHLGSDPVEPAASP